MTEKHEKAQETLCQMFTPQVVAHLESIDHDKAFAGRFNQLSMDHVFEPHWASDGLDLRTRSLVTVAMLIAMRGTDELDIHVPAAVRNGVTIAELEELIYHTTAYAGFPAANAARQAATAALKRAGMID